MTVYFESKSVRPKKFWEMIGKMNFRGLSPRSPFRPVIFNSPYSMFVTLDSKV